MARYLSMLSIALAALAMSGLVLQATEPQHKNDPPGFVSIFDGKTLQGWHVSNKTGHGTGGAGSRKTGPLSAARIRPATAGSSSPTHNTATLRWSWK